MHRIYLRKFIYLLLSFLVMLFSFINIYHALEGGGMVYKSVYICTQLLSMMNYIICRLVIAIYNSLVDEDEAVRGLWLF